MCITLLDLLDMDLRKELERLDLDLDLDELER
jgi:hypothetical protein